MYDDQLLTVSVGNGRWSFVNGEWRDFDGSAQGVATGDVCRDGDRATAISWL